MWLMGAHVARAYSRLASDRVVVVVEPQVSRSENCNAANFNIT